jgi:putative transposase
MPWMETDPKKQRQQFYRDYASGQWSMSELCDRYQVSRPTGYKWIERIESGGLKAVGDRSRAPYRRPNRTPEPIERELLALREKYGWGATKLRQIIERRHPGWSVPARSTVNELLDRHGKLRKGDGGGRGNIPERFRSRRRVPIRSGLRTSRVSSRPATGSTATR